MAALKADDNQSYGNGDVGGPYLKKVDRVPCARIDLASPNSGKHRKKYPQRQETIRASRDRPVSGHRQ